jgi:hypothetical protein
MAVQGVFDTWKEGSVLCWTYMRCASVVQQHMHVVGRAGEGGLAVCRKAWINVLFTRGVRFYGNEGL